MLKSFAIRCFTAVLILMAAAGGAFAQGNAVPVQQQLARTQEARHFGGIQGLDRSYVLRHWGTPYCRPPRRAGGRQ